MNSERPFAVFCGYTYYPAPGWRGYIGAAETLEEACEIATTAIKGQESYMWWQVVDLRVKEIVAGEGFGHTGLFGKCAANPNQEVKNETT